ncbi:MAG: T9SS type A sorting domain-containing protein, partial [Paludibacter sp.]|nr:T9SS type A sorting domain-containing protein [Paludibacter sp.]
LANPSATQDEIDAITDALAIALEDAQNPNGIDNVNLDGILVYSANGKLKIAGLQAGMSIKVYNALGQIVLSKTVSGNNFEQPLQKGLYVVRVNSAINKKLFVK